MEAFITDLRLSQIDAYFSAADKSLQSCLTRCNPVDGNPPGSDVPGILQEAGTREWVAIKYPCNHCFICIP